MCFARCRKLNRSNLHLAVSLADAEETRQQISGETVLNVKGQSENSKSGMSGSAFEPDICIIWAPRASFASFAFEPDV